MERWGENSLYVKGSLEWASLPPANVYQRGWVQREGRDNSASMVIPQKLLLSASPTHHLQETGWNPAATSNLNASPRREREIHGEQGWKQPGRSEQWERRAVGWDEMLPGMHRLPVWREVGLLEDVLKWVPETVRAGIHMGLAMAVSSMESHGQPARRTQSLGPEWERRTTVVLFRRLYHCRMTCELQLAGRQRAHGCTWLSFPSCKVGVIIFTFFWKVSVKGNFKNMCGVKKDREFTKILNNIF